MNRKIYISNLSFSLRDDELKNIFVNFGSVVSAKVVMDRFSGRSKGFGFVEMQTQEEARNAIQALNGAEIAGRNLRVMEATPKPENPQRELQPQIGAFQNNQFQPNNQFQ